MHVPAPPYHAMPYTTHRVPGTRRRPPRRRLFATAPARSDRPLCARVGKGDQSVSKPASKAPVEANQSTCMPQNKLTVRHAVVQPPFQLLQLVGQVRGVQVQAGVHGEGVELGVEHPQDVAGLARRLGGWMGGWMDACRWGIDLIEHAPQGSADTTSTRTTSAHSPTHPPTSLLTMVPRRLSQSTGTVNFPLVSRGRAIS